jgi:hypothetical protein
MGSDKPKIYAYCKAGCPWETAHKDDLKSLASQFKATTARGKAEVDIGIKYKVKYGEADTENVLYELSNYAPYSIGIFECITILNKIYIIRRNGLGQMYVYDTITEECYPLSDIEVNGGYCVVSFGDWIYSFTYSDGTTIEAFNLDTQEKLQFKYDSFYNYNRPKVASDKENKRAFTISNYGNMISVGVLDFSNLKQPALIAKDDFSVAFNNLHCACYYNDKVYIFAKNTGNVVLIKYDCSNRSIEQQTTSMTDTPNDYNYAIVGDNFYLFCSGGGVYKFNMTTEQIELVSYSDLYYDRYAVATADRIYLVSNVGGHEMWCLETNPQKYKVYLAVKTDEDARLIPIEITDSWIDTERSTFAFEVIEQSYDANAKTFSFTYEVDGATFHRASGTISGLNGTMLKECRIVFEGAEQVRIINPIIKGVDLSSETEKREIAQMVYAMIKAGE